jgi:GT2 family glycosyltransferase
MPPSRLWYGPWHSMDISASLVLYESERDLFERAIESFLGSTGADRLYVIDNSRHPLGSKYFLHSKVKYIYNGANIGFGAAHNRAIEIACRKSDLHLILNPDVVFDGQIFERISELFRGDPRIVAAMPRILYPDGSLQRLCKLLPTPVDLLARRFIPLSSVRQRINRRYEMHNLPQDKPIEVPMISGCFLIARSSALLDVGGFDHRYFMYMEDFDLIRRLGTQGKIMYIPEVSIVHKYAKGSYRNRRLMSHHMRSAVQYFNKWGWFLDPERTERNNRAIAALRRLTGLRETSN